MKSGDLIRWNHSALDNEDFLAGLVLEVDDDLVVPPVAWIMWHSGEITKEWTDELEVIREAR